MCKDVWFSVVIPLYNKEDIIESTIDSVLKQTYNKFEIIVVNDGSSDSSLEVVKNIKSEKIKVFDKPNGGVSSARNAGIVKSNYDWIAFLDADDLWECYHLAHLNDLILSSPRASMVSSKSTEVSPDFIPQKSTRNPQKYLISNNFFKDCHSNKFSVHSSSVAVAKKIFTVLGGFLPYNVGEDIEMWARIAMEEEVVMSDCRTSYYRQNFFSGLSGLAFDNYKKLCSKDKKLGLESTPVLRMINEKLNKEPSIFDNDIKRYVKKRLIIGAKFRFAHEDIDGLKIWVSHPDWKKFCSPCVYDIFGFLNVNSILLLRRFYYKIR